MIKLEIDKGYNDLTIRIPFAWGLWIASKVRQAWESIPEASNKVRGYVLTTIKALRRLIMGDASVVVSGKDLNAVLALVSKIVPKNKTFPILGSIRLIAKDGALTLSATDLEMSGKFAIPAEINNTLDLTLPFAEFWGACKGRETITLTLKDKRVIVNDSVSLFWIDSGEYPSFPGEVKGEALSFAKAEFLRGIDATAWAACRRENDSSRASLTGVSITPKRMVATDGHRLSLYRLTGGSGGEIVASPKFLNLLTTLKGLLTDPVTLYHNEKYIALGDAGWMIVSKNIWDERPYPDVEKVIPAKMDTQFTMTVDKVSLDSLVKRAMSFADTYTYQVKFTLNGNLQAESSNPDKGSFKEAIPCEVEAKAGKEAGITIGFNGRYLRTILKALPGPKVQAEFGTALSASIWTMPGNDKRTCLLMPIRLPE